MANEQTYRQIDKYVSLNSLNSSGNIMLKTDYESYSRKIDQLSETTKTILSKYDQYDRIPSAQRKNTQDPVQALPEPSRKKFLAEMEKAGLSYSDYDLHTVHKDLKAGKTGYKTPVYEVNGRPVMGYFFEKPGEKLSEVMAKHHALATLGSKFTGRFGGAAGGLLAAGITASTGASASEVAAAAIPGGQSTLAASQSNFAEAMVSLVEEVPVVGGIIGEGARASNDGIKALGFNGAEMEPSITSTVVEIGRGMMKPAIKVKAPPLGI